MPKAIAKRQTKRPAPYKLRASTANMTALAPPMGHWMPPSHHHQHQQSMSWSDQTNYPYSYTQSLNQNYMPTLPTVVGPTPIAQPAPGQSTPWTIDEDNTLVEAKSQGLGWNDIHQRHFPLKSGNACRKRHERLMQKIRTTNWDDGRVARVMTEYNKAGVRERFWAELAARIGEDRWEDVERVVREQKFLHLAVGGDKTPTTPTRESVLTAFSLI